MTHAKPTKEEHLLKKIEEAKKELKLHRANQKKKQRKIENRTKIIIGGTVLAHMKHDEVFRGQINQLINQYGRKQDKDYLKRHHLITGFNLIAACSASKPDASTPLQRNTPT